MKTNNHEVWQHCALHGWWDARQHGLVCPDCTTTLVMKHNSKKKPKQDRQLYYDADDLRCPITGIKYGANSQARPLAVKIVKLPKARK